MLGIRSTHGVTDAQMRSWLEKDNVAHMELPPLDEESARELVAANSPNGELPDEIVAYVDCCRLSYQGCHRLSFDM